MSEELILPTLRWLPEANRWQPFRGLQPCDWPPEVEPQHLPRPTYTVGTRVYFEYVGPRPWEGIIQLIELPGGRYQPWEDVYELIARRYYRPEAIVYLIQARGHLRLVRAPRVVGLSTGSELRPLLEHGYEEF
ncbi:hypothetical protein [Thermogemmatispora tikiterensis]|uniref:Uncharacterized protein n=1 Tax=Thermogemmatispora tikiterensis TaxID=1825093 RepID=A0A328VR54_9CHLR|nr:hypothetical protein [Thermogemmatispora tikiterensis]RAQ98210.1 hypothetical protein A4R35_21895 [Thermogemmatispora tikiterensis]